MLHFGLLTDFADAKEEAMPTDASLLALASQRIAGLNDKYGDGRDDVFFLFHRPRRYNANEGMWMGEERKRGKLAALNALLRGDTNGAFFARRRAGRCARQRQVCHHAGHGYTAAARLRPPARGDNDASSESTDL